MSSRPLKVAIVGGGVCGLACAVGLLKQGIDVHVYEAAARFTSLVVRWVLTGVSGAGAVQRDWSWCRARYVLICYSAASRGEFECGDHICRAQCDQRPPRSRSLRRYLCASDRNRCRERDRLVAPRTAHGRHARLVQILLGHGRPRAALRRASHALGLRARADDFVRSTAQTNRPRRAYTVPPSWPRSTTWSPIPPSRATARGCSTSPR